jgi:hypothetical protein
MAYFSKVYRATLIDINDERAEELLKRLREWDVKKFWFWGQERRGIELEKLTETKEGTIHFTVFTCTHSGISYEESGFACGVSSYYGEYIERELLTPLVEEGKVTLEYIDLLC